jgi:hypothetical protein
MASIINYPDLGIKLAHQENVTLTATTPGTGADATTWTGAQCTAAYNDIAALITRVNALIVSLENIGVLATV